MITITNGTAQRNFNFCPHLSLYIGSPASTVLHVPDSCFLPTRRRYLRTAAKRPGPARLGRWGGGALKPCPNNGNPSLSFPLAGISFEQRHALIPRQETQPSE